MKKSKLIKCFMLFLFLMILFSNQTFMKENIFKKEINKLEVINKFVKNYRDSYYIYKYTKQEGVPLDLFLSLIKNETYFNAKAKNHNKNGTVDYGYCQLNSRSYPEYTEEQLMNPETNIRLGVLHLKKALQQSGGNQIIAMHIYNAGAWNVYIGNVGYKTIKYAFDVIKFKDTITYEI